MGANASIIVKGFAEKNQFVELKKYLDNNHIARGPGGDIDQVDDFGWSGVYFASSTGSLDCLKILLDHGASIRLTDNDGQQPALVAAREGKLDCLELLLDASANINFQDYYGNTCLHLASHNGHYDCCRVLMKKGADTTIRNKVFFYSSSFIFTLFILN